MKSYFFSIFILPILLCGALVFAADAAAQAGSGSDEPMNPCYENPPGWSQDWAVFHIWCFKTGVSTDVDTFAKEDILRMEAQCPGTHFKKGGTIRREGPDAILYKTTPDSQFGPIFIAYYKADCGIVRQLCRAGNEEMGRYAYSNFLRNVKGDYGLCIK